MQDPTARMPRQMDTCHRLVENLGLRHQRHQQGHLPRILSRRT